MNYIFICSSLSAESLAVFGFLAYLGFLAPHFFVSDNFTFFRFNVVQQALLAVCHV